MTMYLRTREALNNEVHKINEVYKILNKVIPLVIAELKPFIGDKIIKTDEYLIKKFTDKVEFLVNMRETIKVKPLKDMKYASCHCLYVNATRYSITVKVSCSFSVSDHGCNYCEETVYIGDIQNKLMGKAGNATLEKVHEYTPKAMLSPAKEWAKYVKAAKAKEAFEVATNSMFYGLREWVR